MLELAMAAARCNQKPTIVIKHPQHLTNLHRTKNTALEWRGQSGLVVLLLNFKVDGRKASLYDGILRLSLSSFKRIDAFTARNDIKRFRDGYGP